MFYQKNPILYLTILYLTSEYALLHILMSSMQYVVMSTLLLGVSPEPDMKRTPHNIKRTLHPNKRALFVRLTGSAESQSEGTIHLLPKPWEIVMVIPRRRRGT